MDYNYRDVAFIKLKDNQYITTACDSCGAIGLKENDIVKVPYYITGKYTARVCLMEILSVGAKPLGITANICNEPVPTGEEILRGIHHELLDAGFDIPITMSTEKNMETSMTALGITVIGIINKDNILLDRISKGDNIYAVGIPSVGDEVLENEGLTANTKMLIELLKHEYIKEIIPVGSSGIKGELNSLCEAQDINIQLVDELQVDIYKSAGPSTAVLVISEDKLRDKFSVPINLIGKIL